MPAPAAVAASTSAAAAPERRRRAPAPGAALCLALALVLAVAGTPATVPAGPDGPGTAPATADSARVTGAAGCSWLRRILHRYFSNDVPEGSALGGQAVALAEPYARFAGLPIAVVIVHQVDRLRPEGAPRGDLLSPLARALRPYTSEGVLRQYLRFHQGEPLDPLKLADSERLLRSLEYVADVRLHVVPLTGGEHEVAVVVEVRDRLPLGARWAVRDVDRLDAGLFHTNVGGQDLRVGLDLWYRQGVTPETGWGATVRKRNLGGSFLSVEAAYEDSWRGLGRRLAVGREEAHPDIRWVGGFAWSDRREREPGRPVEQADRGDGWVGRVLRVRGAGAAAGERPVLVPAFGVATVHFDERPAVAPDTNRAWHDSRQLLAGLTWSRARDWRTSFLDGLGETENLQAGRGLKLSAAYVDGEFHDRTGLFLQGWRQDVHGGGHVLGLGLDLGGYLRSGRLEDGALRARVHYVSPLAGGDRWRWRLLGGLRFDRAVRPADDAPLSLAEGLGPRGVDLSTRAGDTRLVADGEWRVFAPWVVAGFRCQLFGFCDGALMGDRGRGLGAARLLSSAGLGLRLGNPDLVLPTVQLRVAFLGGMEDNADGVVFAAGDFAPPETRLPGARPGAFEFR